MEAITGEMIGVSVNANTPKKVETPTLRMPVREANVTNLAAAAYDVSPMPFAQDRAMLLAQFNTKLKAISPEERIKIMTDLCSKAAEDAQTLLSEKNYSRALRATDMLLLLTTEAKTPEMYTLTAKVLLSQLANTSMLAQLNMHDFAKEHLRTILPNVSEVAVRKECEAALKEPEKPPIKSENGFTSIFDLLVSLFRKKQLKSV